MRLLMNKTLGKDGPALLSYIERHDTSARDENVKFFFWASRAFAEYGKPALDMVEVEQMTTAQKCGLD